ELVRSDRFGRGPAAGGSPGHHGHERGAVTVQAAVVDVAGGLLHAGLAAELGRHRLHRQAVGLAPAVSAALADPLVDEHPGLRLGDLAPLALAALLGGALLVVHEHGDPWCGREDPLGLGDPGAVPHGHPAGQLDATVAAE